ncbi:MAG: hypothetical protein Q9179_002145 [Wetmoreana sp. 5 TL-2023]
MSTPSPPLHLIIRFALPVPDLPLTIPTPSTTTPFHLFHQHIRPHLPPTYRSCPIRLIASGALLPPSIPLSKSLRLPSSPKPTSSIKGKEKETFPSPSPAPSPIYIHCSISTTQTLSPSALALEASASASATASAETRSPTSPEPTQSQGQQQQQQRTWQQPRGFDRLLSAGLSPQEITSLRSQFLALTAHTHTPDTMPSPTSMRRLEERWLDNSGPNAGVANATADGAERVSIEDDDDGRGALEDMLWGNLMGFFWPVGAAVWLCREEGVWSKRRQVAVVTGVLVNLAFGLMRMGGG